MANPDVRARHTRDPYMVTWAKSDAWSRTQRTISDIEVRGMSGPKHWFSGHDRLDVDGVVPATSCSLKNAAAPVRVRQRAHLWLYKAETDRVVNHLSKP